MNKQIFCARKGCVEFKDQHDGRVIKTFFRSVSGIREEQQTRKFRKLEARLYRRQQAYLKRYA